MGLFGNAFEDKMKDLVLKLNGASDAYYNGTPIMTDHEYDKLFDQLRDLESKCGKVLDNSPSKNVGAPLRAVTKLNKVTHQFPAKSLDKTKSVEDVKSIYRKADSKDNRLILMYKLDGATVQLTYKDGKLVTAATRGNGEVGQDITHNAPSLLGIPLQLQSKYNMTVRGEAIITYSQFEAINNSIENTEYKNPRNLASATITMLDPKEVATRGVQFMAFELVDGPAMDGMDFQNRFKLLKYLGFEVVPNMTIDLSSLDHSIELMTKDAKDSGIPVDGLVMALNDTYYSSTFEGTEHHPHPFKGYAFKWEDEEVRTTLRDIEWSPSRTGTLTPVAIFDPVEIDGTEVSRASVHNVSILKNLNLHMGDQITVYKANLIIPQIAENLTYNETGENFNHSIIPETCPVCGETTSLVTSDDGIETLHCFNENCSARIVDRLVHFASRDCMDIEGLSEATILQFVKLGYLSDFSSIYKLHVYEDDIKKLEGFGEVSCTKLLQSINDSSHTTMQKVLSSLGIPNVGTKQSKLLSRHFNGNIDNFLSSKKYDFTKIDGIGEIINDGLHSWLNDKDKQFEVDNLLQFLDVENSPNEAIGGDLQGFTFVITGSVNNFSNRKELEGYIESLGGKVGSSVSKKTSYLINNDITSSSSKNVRAMELGIPIITEDEFLAMVK